MTTDEPQPLTGAQFARLVGSDPEKWATRFLDAAAEVTEWSVADRLAFTTAWFRDAMEAAVKHAAAPRWDQQYSDEDLEAAAKRAAPAWDKLNKASE